ncbi:MAG: hypothetical protein EBT03_11425, partial [Betaproteobacteria bacterium]|nr:hypothetical protein [Betaproteobacteria bacterium]
MEAAARVVGGARRGRPPLKWEREKEGQTEGDAACSPTDEAMGVQVGDGTGSPAPMGDATQNPPWATGQKRATEKSGDAADVRLAIQRFLAKYPGTVGAVFMRLENGDIICVTQGKIPGLDPGLGAFLGAAMFSDISTSDHFSKAMHASSATGQQPTPAPPSTLPISPPAPPPISHASTTSAPLKKGGLKPWGSGGAASQVSSLPPPPRSNVKNLGNTCFMGAIIQLLASLTPFVLALRDHATACKVHIVSEGNSSPLRCISCALLDVLEQVLEAKCEFITPNLLASSLELLGLPGTFTLGYIGDAPEFLTHIVDALMGQESFQLRLPEAGGSGGSLSTSSSSSSSSTSAPPPLPLNGGSVCRSAVGIGACLFSTVFQCTTACGPLAHPSPGKTVAEAMISLPVPQHGRGLTLETLLSDFFAPEIMRGENAVYCATCKRLTDARRNQSIKIPPSILVLQLLRFTCPKSFGLFWQTQKVHTRVRTPLTLDMGPYLQLTPKQLSAAYAAGGTMQRTEDGKDMPGTLSVLYTLAAMVEHDGPSPRAGHYWAYIPVVELEGGMAKWYRMDDQRPDLARSPLAFEAICDRPAYVVAYLPMNPALVSALSSAADVLPDALIPPAASTTAALSSFS